MHLGEIINEYRNKHGLSMDDFAEKSGISKAYISILEKNRHPRDGKPVAPSDEMYMKVARAINMKIDELLKMVGKDQYIIINADNQKSTVDSRLIDKYKNLDYHGKKAIDTLLDIEYERCQEKSQRTREEVKVLPFPSMPVSAGTGQYLDSTEETNIEVPLTNLTAKADFVLRVSGDSMEPMYSSGDIILVQKDDVEVGEVGIFIVDGEGYIKRKGEDQLESINPDYNGVSGDDVRTVGKVIGKV